MKNEIVLQNSERSHIHHPCYIVLTSGIYTHHIFINPRSVDGVALKIMAQSEEKGKKGYLKICFPEEDLAEMFYTTAVKFASDLVPQGSNFINQAKKISKEDILSYLNP